MSALFLCKPTLEAARACGSVRAGGRLEGVQACEVGLSRLACLPTLATHLSLLRERAIKERMTRLSKTEDV